MFARMDTLRRGELSRQRGSRAAPRAIFADWGNYEVQDLLAGVDHVIKMGVADPDRWESAAGATAAF